MGEKDQVRRVAGRPAPVQARRVGSSGPGAEVVDLGAWKRRRKVQVAGRYGLLRRMTQADDSRGPA